MVMMERVHTGGSGSVNHHRMNTTERGRWEMSKRLVVIGALCIGLMGLWSIDAHAWPASSSGWGATQNTVIIWSGWRGIANTDLKPTSVRVILDSIVVQAQCINHGGGDGGLGNPFMIPAPVQGSQASPQKAIKNGNWQSYITFDEVKDFGLTLDSSYCINPNWTNVGFVTKSFVVYIQAFEDVDTRCSFPPFGDMDTCYTACTYDSSTKVTMCPNYSTDAPWKLEEVVHIEGHCDLGSAPIGVGSEYTCFTDFQWEYIKNKSTYCPDVSGCDYPL